MVKDIYVETLDNTKYINFTFSGILKEKDAKNAIDEFSKIAKNTQKEIILIWNCLEMKNYEHEARILWQKKLKHCKSQIKEIWLISDSKIIKAGAELISLFTSYKIKIIESDALLHAKQ